MTTPLPLPTLLIIALQGKAIARMIGDVATLGIADHLQDNVVPVSQLAADSGCHEDALYRVLRALSALGIFVEKADRCFANSEASSYMRRNVPGSVHDFLVWENCKPFWNAFSHFDHCLRSGESSFTHANGLPLFDYLKEHPETGKVFNDAMTHGSLGLSPLIAECYDFTEVKTLVDVGGGHGLLLKTLLRQHKHLQGIVFDLPQVVDGADAEELQTRLQFAGGNFFESLPQNADIYTIKHIIHDWNDELSIKLLSKCHKVMSEHGRVLVIEQVVNDSPEGVFAKLADIEMLAITHNGRERTEAEFAELFKAAGLKLERVIPTGKNTICILEGVKYNK